MSPREFGKFYTELESSLNLKMEGIEGKSIPSVFEVLGEVVLKLVQKFADN